jgi:hypothetical protein
MDRRFYFNAAHRYEPAARSSGEVIVFIGTISRLFSQAYFKNRKFARINKILQRPNYFVNFKLYSSGACMMHAKSQTNSNIQSSETQVKQIGLRPD